MGLTHTVQGPTQRNCLSQYLVALYRGWRCIEILYNREFLFTDVYGRKGRMALYRGSGGALSGLTLYSNTCLHPLSLQNAAVPSWFPIDSLYPIVYIQLQVFRLLFFFLQLLLVYVLHLSRFTSDLINMLYYFVYKFPKIS